MIQPGSASWAVNHTHCEAACRELGPGRHREIENCAHVIVLLHREFDEPLGHYTELTEKKATMRRILVEECEIVRATDTSRLVELGFRFGTVPTRGGGRRQCLHCPNCGRKAFKLYRPCLLQGFACRTCHDLSYSSVQKQDSRLDRLLALPESELMDLVLQDENMAWKLHAIRAGYIRLGLMSKY
jgi:hypothetical protein